MAISPTLPTRTGALIIGAGPTGLTVGLELARRGIDFLLVDKHPEPLPWDRATVIHSRTLEIFDALGIVDEFLERGHRMNGVNFFAYGVKFVTLRFDSVDGRFPYDLNLSEQFTEEILTRRMEALGGKVSRGWKLASLEQHSASVTARLQGGDGVERTIEADWLVVRMVYAAPCVRLFASRSTVIGTPPCGESSTATCKTGNTTRALRRSRSSFPR
jgi:2-polyprenyl-6-methoxyphenol hydroxylase-like FAD-dependent oxidoreductase